MQVISIWLYIRAICLVIIRFLILVTLTELVTGVKTLLRTAFNLYVPKLIYCLE